MNIYTAEQIIIACSLKYGKQATIHLLPDLTADKFVYSADGEFGGTDHRKIWQRIHDLCLIDKVEPTIAGVGFQQEYLYKLVGGLEQLGIFSLDVPTLQNFGRAVDKSGVTYNIYRMCQEYGLNIMTEDLFLKRYESISDLEKWLSEIVYKFQEVYQVGTKGYKHVSEIGDRLLDRWERQYSGEQLTILPSGWPTLAAAQLFPRGQLAVLHGMSNMGKSAFMLAVLLGTAIGIKRLGIKGCVAINSLEMSDLDLLGRCAAMLAGVDRSRLLGGKTPLTADEYARLKQWLEFVKTLPLYVDDSPLMTTDTMRYLASTLHNSDKGPLLQVGADYTELFGDEADNKEQEVNLVTRNLFAMSRLFDASVIAISQSTYGANPSKTYIAGINGLRYSRGVTHAADIVVEMMNYPEMDNKGINFNIPENGEFGTVLDRYSAWLLVEKYREGATGAVSFGWQAPYTRFFDLELAKQSGSDILMYEKLDELAKEYYNYSIEDRKLAGELFT